MAQRFACRDRRPWYRRIKAFVRIFVQFENRLECAVENIKSCKYARICNFSLPKLALGRRFYQDFDLGLF